MAVMALYRSLLRRVEGITWVIMLQISNTFLMDFLYVMRLHSVFVLASQFSSQPVDRKPAAVTKNNICKNIRFL